MNKTLIKDLNELKSFVETFAAELLNSKTQNIVLLFRGDLGAGKTTFIRTLGKALDIQDNITSPTFVAMNEYHNDLVSLYHLDLYQSAIDLGYMRDVLEEAIGEGSSSHKNIFAIEWSENWEERFGLDVKGFFDGYGAELYCIEIKVGNDDSRNLNINK